MGDPPPLIRCPPSDNASLFAATASVPPEPSPPSPHRSQRVSKQSRTSATAFHKRKSKHANKLESCKAARDCPGIGKAVIGRYQAASDNEDNNANRGGHAVGVVVAAPGKIPIEQSELKARNLFRADERQEPREETAAAADTIRKRIKFIMGDDEEEEEDEDVDRENSKQPPAKGSSCKKMPRLDSASEPSSSVSPESTIPSKLRLRTRDTGGSGVPQHQPESKKTSLGCGTKEAKTKKKQQRKDKDRTTPASTSNRTRSRFFSRFNKRTIRAVVLLVVKLCGLLVASILIPSSKQLVTAVDSGFDQAEPSAPAAPTNLDDLLDEYGDMSGLDGYASSTIIAISPANGNYHDYCHCSALPAIIS